MACAVVHTGFNFTISISEELPLSLCPLVLLRSDGVAAENKNFFPVFLQIHYFPSADADDRIVRPNSMWTAGCCVWNDESEIQRAQSIAVMGNNDFQPGRIGMRSMNLAELEKLLVDKNSESVRLFPAVKECRSNSYLL